MLPSRRSLVLALTFASLVVPGRDRLAAQHDHGWDVTVLPDRMAFGTEYVPRISGGPNDWQVPAGQTQTFPQTAVFEHLEIAGTAILPDNFNLHVRTLLVFPGGTLLCQDGTKPTRGTITTLDSPINLDVDPHQLGTGIVSAGTFRCVGPAKVGWARLTDDVTAGATVLPIVTPDSWQIGDEVTITDSRQMGPVTSPNDWRAPRRDGPFTIVAKTPTSLTISGPLAFERLAIREPAPSNELVTRAVVQNLTRELRIVPQVPTGTRGHQMAVGNQATLVFRNGEVRQQGRTCNGVLDPVTCHVGRYGGWHVHHLGDGSGSEITGSVFIGRSATAKWGGVILHDTRNVLVAGNLVTETNGWGFGTEDGNESGNRFIGNFCSYVSGAAVANVPDMVERNFSEGQPGTEGSCFGLRTIDLIFEGNETWNAEIGTNLLAILRFIPNIPQGTANYRVAGNRDFSHRVRGLENWGVGFEHLIEDHTAAYSGETQIWNGGAGSVHPHHRNLRVVCEGAVSEGFHGNGAYVPRLTVIGGEIRGCKQGFGSGVANIKAVVEDVILQNEINFDLENFFPYELRARNVRFEPLGNLPKKGFWLNQGAPWQPGQSLGGASYVNYARQRGPQWTSEDHNGVPGQHFDLLMPSQVSTAPAWFGAAYNETFINLTPEIGLTMAEAREKYCLTLRGDMYLPGTAVADEWVSGIARPFASRPAPCPAGVVLTSPSVHAPAPRTEFNMYFQLTGAGAPDPLSACVSTDGGPAYCFSGVAVEDTLGIPRVRQSEGTHTATSWRVTAQGAEMSGSRRTQTYCVVVCDGAPPPPPPPPPTEICGNGVDDDGDGLIDEDCAPAPQPGACTTITAAGETLTAPDGAVWSLQFGAYGDPKWAFILRDGQNMGVTDQFPAVRLSGGEIYRANFFGTRHEYWGRFGGAPNAWTPVDAPSCGG